MITTHGARAADLVRAGSVDDSAFSFDRVPAGWDDHQDVYGAVRSV